MKGLEHDLSEDFDWCLSALANELMRPDYLECYFQNPVVSERLITRNYLESQLVALMENRWSFIEHSQAFLTLIQRFEV